MSVDEDAERYEKLIEAVNLALHREDQSDRTVHLEKFKAMEPKKR